MNVLNHKKSLKLKLRTALLLALTCFMALAPAGYAASENTNTIVYGVLSETGALEETYLVAVSEKNGPDEYKQSLEENYVLPWQFTFEYVLDDQAIAPHLLGGKSGHLSMTIKINENEKSASPAFSKFGLQMVISMPAGAVENLVAPNASIAYKGGERQIIYTLMPGESHEIHLTCDVTKLEMAPIYITAMPMSLPFDLPNTTETKDKLTTFKAGTDELKTASALLSDASNTFLKSVNKLKQGATQMKSALDISLSKGDEVATLMASNDAFLSEMKLKTKQLEQLMAQADLDSLVILKGQYQQALQTIGLIEANQQVITAQSTGLASLSTGMNELVKGLNALAKGAADMNKGLIALHEGTVQLNAGILQGEAEFESLFSQLERMQTLDDTPTESNSSSVTSATENNPTQFVLRTPAIRIAEEVIAPVQDTTESLNLWERILKLFGFN